MLQRLLGQLGLARLLRVGVSGSIPPLWAEIVILHYRGSFHSPSMWIPVVTLPAVLIGGTVSALTTDQEASRARFRLLAWLMTALGLSGTFFHLRGVNRQMGGFYNWKYNLVTGPPFPAPLQIALLGALGVVASAPPSPSEDEGLVRAIRVVNVGAYTMLAVESGYDHWMGGLYNPFMFTPLVLSPLMVLVHLAALARLRTARSVEGPLSLLATLSGLVGFGFHLWNLYRRPGFTWQKLFYGAPWAAPLQMTGLGLLGALAAVADEESNR